MFFQTIKVFKPAEARMAQYRGKMVNQAIRVQLIQPQAVLLLCVFMTLVCPITEQKTSPISCFSLCPIQICLKLAIYGIRFQRQKNKPG